MVPQGSVARTFSVREVRALPREVMVVKERATTFEHLIERVARVEVQWQRDEVLDDHQVGVDRSRPSTRAVTSTSSRRSPGSG